MFEYSEAKTLEELFYPTYDLSDFSWDSINRTLNHTALTAEFTGIPATGPSGSFSNGSLAFRVSPRGQRGGIAALGRCRENTVNIPSKAPSREGTLPLGVPSSDHAVPLTCVLCR